MSRFAAPSGITWRGAAGGALSAIITAGMGLALAVAGSVVLDWDKPTRTGVFTVAAFVGFLLGGFRAALLEGRAPYSNAAASGALAAIVYTAVGVVQGGRNPVGIIFGIGLAAVVATIGGMVGASRNNQMGRR
jgi:hypothetical protein